MDLTVPGAVVEGTGGLRAQRHSKRRCIQLEGVVAGIAVELESQIVELALLVDEVVNACVDPGLVLGIRVEVDVCIEIGDGNAFVLDAVAVDVRGDGRFFECAPQCAVALELAPTLRRQQAQVLGRDSATQVECVVDVAIDGEIGSAQADAQFVELPRAAGSHDSAAATGGYTTQATAD